MTTDEKRAFIATREIRRRLNRLEEIEPIYEGLRIALQHIINDLPSNKDWLNPDNEAAARAMLDAAKRHDPR